MTISVLLLTSYQVQSNVYKLAMVTSQGLWKSVERETKSLPFSWHETIFRRWLGGKTAGDRPDSGPALGSDRTGRMR